MNRITMVVSRIERVADDINRYVLRTPDDSFLPAAEAGAHIDLILPNGIIRQYSLVSPGETPTQYEICVKKDRGSRGGSRLIHEALEVGSRLQINLPRNNFQLREEAARSILIAGGIGITPIWSMAQRLQLLGRPWVLHYACRRRSEAAFLPDLAAFGPEVVLHFDDENGGRPLDLDAIVAGSPAAAHLYCCGPLAMLERFQALTRNHDAESVHVEYFSSKPVEKAFGGFHVELAISGRELFVASGRSILDVVREAGVSVPYSCEEGICGTCETRVLAGQPDHHDMLLTDTERASGETMMICCSGSLGPRLVLDL